MKILLRILFMITVFVATFLVCMIYDGRLPRKKHYSSAILRDIYK